MRIYLLNPFSSIFEKPGNYKIPNQEFVYASPRQGYGQLALSLSCRDLGKQAVVFVPKGKRHQLTIDSEKYGAEIHEVPMGFLSNLNHKSKKYCAYTI